jgi:quercetin dioxygenase-like cupin family protein
MVNPVDYSRGEEMPIVTGVSAPVHEFDGTEFHSLAVPSRGTKELAVWRAVMPPGKVGAEHSLSREEVLVVVRGNLSGAIGGEEVAAGPGDAVIFPAHTPGQLSNASDTEPLEFLCCTSAGIEGYLGDRAITPPWSL